MQDHLAKCIKFPQRSQQATSDKNHSASIRVENDEWHLIDRNSSWSSWNQKFLLAQWKNVVREIMMYVLLKLCMQLVHLWCSLAMCIGRDFWMFFTQHTPLQPDMLYLLIYWMQSSSEGQANHIAIISDGWLNVLNLHPSPSILQEHRHKGQQTHRSLHCRWAEGCNQWPWTTEGICTGDRLCSEHESCLV